MKSTLVFNWSGLSLTKAAPLQLVTQAPNPSRYSLVTGSEWVVELHHLSPIMALAAPVPQTLERSIA